MPSKFLKTADEVLDYKFDAKALTNGTGDSDWLASGEVIASHTITPEAGITVDSSSQEDTNTSVQVWLSGGALGGKYEVACEIVTDSVPARTMSRSIFVTIVPNRS